MYACMYVCMLCIIYLCLMYVCMYAYVCVYVCKAFSFTPSTPHLRQHTQKDIPTHTAHTPTTHTYRPKYPHLRNRSGKGSDGIESMLRALHEQEQQKKSLRVSE